MTVPFSSAWMNMGGIAQTMKTKRQMMMEMSSSPTVDLRLIL
jgi:hypothetical protein